MVLLVIILLIIIIYLSYSYRNLSKNFDEFSSFLDKAIEGDLAINDFDEKELSKLKTKLVKFLYTN